MSENNQAKKNKYPLMLGTACRQSATKVLILGAGELAKEFTIELQRLGIHVLAADRYAHAPAMHVAHESCVFDLHDGDQILTLVNKHKPDFIVPEIEAIDTQVLKQLEEQGFTVIPNARAAHLTMNREGIRRAASEVLELPTAAYAFANSYEECVQAVNKIGLPCVIKPSMSSSGKGQSVIKNEDDIRKAWDYALGGARGKSASIIVEEFIQFDYEITLLTIRTHNDTLFCSPIGHTQIDGDYRESWQPHAMSDHLLQKAQNIAQKVTDYLGGIGIFGVELFIKGDDVLFSEVSPRPHDTGMVTLISQNLSEFALHARAILGLPIPEIELYGPSASSALLLNGTTDDPYYINVDKALSLPLTDVRLFGKPTINGSRRMGVGLAKGKTIQEAREKARFVTTSITLSPKKSDAFIKKNSYNNHLVSN